MEACLPYLESFKRMDPPFEWLADSMPGEAFADELTVTSRLWFKTGYGQGIAAYLNFFLLKDFIETHDAAYPPRFASFRSMADSFYRTDVFIREVTDSGKEPTGGISNPRVRESLAQIMRRHERLSIPIWMMTYFGFQLLEAVEQQCAPISDAEKRLHLAYMAKTYRVMGIPFSEDRALMEQFARGVERTHAGVSPNLEVHARHILRLGEMVGVSSKSEHVASLLPEATREVFLAIHHRVRPGPFTRLACRAAGRLLMKQAVGRPRAAVPFQEVKPD